MPTTEEVLVDRGARYGKFETHAEITQKLKDVMIRGLHLGDAASERVKSRIAMMKPDQIECLEMLAHKIGRMLNGDPHYGDNFRDASGYSKLVADRLEGVGEVLPHPMIHVVKEPAWGLDTEKHE